MGNMTREELKKVSVKPHVSATLLLWSLTDLSPPRVCVQVLVSRYPQLTVVSDRLLDIYCQLTGERHSESDAGSLQSPDSSQQAKCEEKSAPLEGRALSLR